jgi:hypothetical protein
MGWMQEPKRCDRCIGLEAEVERLKAETERHKRWHQKPTHGTCCTCQACGLDYDTCRCDLDDVAGEAERLREENALLKRSLAILHDAFESQPDTEEAV